MRTPLLGGLVLLALLGTAQTHAVDVDLSIRTPGLSLYIGDRDRSGHYWDGQRWRDERWWYDNCHRYEHHRNFRGHCVPRGHDAPPPPQHCPPGQAKKGRC